MGRRSIPIQPIRDERNRSVTFVKRKAGLFKKAHELSVLCQVEIALVIVGANGKIFEFSSSSVDQVMKRYKKTEVQEFKTTKDFSDQRHYNHSRKSSHIDSDDEEEAIKEEYYQPQPQQQQQQQQQAQAQAQAQVSQSQSGPQPQTQQRSPSSLPPVQPQQTSAVQASQSQIPQQVVPLIHHQSQMHGHPPPPIPLSSHARPKLTVQIPHAPQEEAKKQPSGWTPQRQLMGQWPGQDQGVSPTGPYYQVQPQPTNDPHQQQQLQHQQRMAMQNGDPTPISTTLPSKYMMDSMQSPSNFFSSEWGVPWSANPNSSFMRPGPMSQPHMAGPANAAAGGVPGHPGPISQQQQQDPRQIPGMYLPPNVNVYSGGMPSAGVQTMFQSSPVQFTPNDAKRKSDDQLQGDNKRKDF